MSIQNPLWQVHNALWSLLEADAAFCLAVPEMNRVKYTSTVDRHPDKDNALSADYAMVRIRQTGMKPRPHRTSNSSMIELKFSIEVYTGDQRFATDDKRKFSDVQIAIYKAFVNWQDYLYDFEWSGIPFYVRFCRALEVTDELSRDDLHKKQLGWKSAWLGEMDIWFETSDLTLTIT